jgi:murein DD-endopeptidase MepM/ murein hydrolase activator NlpD
MMIKGSKLLATVATAAVLTGCSGQLDRFSAGYKNPSDADPVYTASVPKAKPLVKSRVIEDDQIASTPLEPSSKWRKISNGGGNEDVTRPTSRNLFALNKSNDESTAYKQPDQDVLADQEPVLPRRPTEVAAAPRAGKSGKIRVEPGMTLYGIARANDIGLKQLAKANGIRSPYHVAAGDLITIPGKSKVRVPSNSLVAQKRQIETPDIAESTDIQTSDAASSGPASHEVKSGDTIYSLSRAYGVAPHAIAEANNMRMSSRLSVGQQLSIPGGHKASMSQDDGQDVAGSEPASNDGLSKQSSQLALQQDDAMISENPVSLKKVPPLPQTGANDGAQQADATSGNALQPTSAAMSLRWPLRGKIISEFGTKPNGMKNEGVNIAVPEGTPIRAAEEGIVAYAGNELKGYGNLILIRHEGGYVTAYAHAKELEVKRGDSVKRGDVIAKAGQSGAVSSPQLHFEVRKGATALDPIKFLGSSTASN